MSRMSRTLQDRVVTLEDAALRVEGALFALHDVIAHSLAQAPAAEVQGLIATLSAHAEQLDAALGAERIAGYRNELASIAQEIDHARRDPQGIMARFGRL